MASCTNNIHTGDNVFWQLLPMKAWECFFLDRVKELMVYFDLHGSSLYLLRREGHEKLSYEH